MESINKAIKELYLNKVNEKVPEEVFEDLNFSFLLDKSTKQKELSFGKTIVSLGILWYNIKVEKRRFLYV